MLLTTSAVVGASARRVAGQRLAFS